MSYFYYSVMHLLSGILLTPTILVQNFSLWSWIIIMYCTHILCINIPQQQQLQQQQQQQQNSEVQQQEQQQQQHGQQVCGQQQAASSGNQVMFTELY